MSIFWGIIKEIGGLVKKRLMDKIPFYNKLVLPVHFLRALMAGVRYGFPARKMTVIGVTGTNGKTTTSFMIWKMLNEAGYKTGILSTVAWGVTELTKQVEHMTTVDAVTLNKRITEISKRGAEFLVLETTSHALAQFRTLGIPIEIAVLTNVTHEHLDYHGTFEKYRAAKQKLFRRAKFAVVNADDPSANWFLPRTGQGEKYITYGMKKGEIRASKMELSPIGVSYNIHGVNILRSEKAVGVTDASHYKTSEMVIRTQIPGEFNIYNSLAAVAVGLRLGLSEDQIVRGVYALETVEGRMNKVSLGQDFTVIVDYAHTPDAFLKVYQSVCVDGGGLKGVKTKRGSEACRTEDSDVRGEKGEEEAGERRKKRVIKGASLEKGRIITVTGGAGRRDESTREIRGEIAGKYSDILIITEDDSRDEVPERIAEQFVLGAKKAGMKQSQIIVNLSRAEAINAAISMARKDDVVLILGKGHEKTILRADGAYPFEDLVVVREALEKVVKK